MTEEWREITEFPGYWISNMGNVRSFRKTGLGGISDTPKLVSPNNSRGYKTINLWVNGKVKTKKIHRLVCEYFIGPSDMPVNHINGIKSDNRLVNLEYTTAKKNAQHCKNVLGKGRGTKVNTAKLDNQKVLEIVRRHRDGESTTDLSIAFDVSVSSIDRILSGRSWSWLTRINKGTRKRWGKLTMDDVFGIRCRLASNEKHRLIADDYGVHKSTIDRISQGKAWAWLDESNHNNDRLHEAAEGME